MIVITDTRLILRYFALNYPYKNELSKTRITKMVYLADWMSAQENQIQLTDIKWYFDNYGPYVCDVYDEARRDNKLTIKHDYSMYGSPKEVIELKTYDISNLGLNKLSKKEIKILDKVITNTEHLNWSEFIEYVYSTYPIKTQKRYNYLDLVELAQVEKSKSRSSVKW